MTSYAKRCLVPIVLVQEETNLCHLYLPDAGVGEVVGAIENNCCVQSGALTRSQPGPVVSDGDPKALQIPRDFSGDLLAGAA